MRLKRMELIGFKSFANKTIVDFDRGVTCVVGPNGCGKSNISDAMRWVLGERSAKMLRGSKMEDVIFNGTDFRKPLSFAEVSLTIDNENRGLPIDYNEVTITRRLGRDGQSTYLLNKTPVRLKDVQDLILDTGIGSNSYSMIEQGRIDYILRADPEKRRFLIEEAAGISKYKTKKDEAIRKLERTEHNLERINDIIQEVHKNIQYAERQAKRAERYKKQYEELKNLEITKAFRDLNLLQTDKSSLQGKRSGEQVELEKLEAERREKKELLTNKEEELRVTQEKISAEEGHRYRKQSEKEKNDQQFQFNQEKRVEYARRKGEIEQELLQLSNRLEKNTTELESKKAELEKLVNEKSDIQGNLEGSKGRLREAEERLERVKSDLSQSKIKAFELATEITRVKNEYHRMLAFIETSTKQKDKMSGNLERFTSEHEDWESKRTQYETTLVDVKRKEESLSNTEAQLENELQVIDEKIQTNAEKERELDKYIHEKETRLAMLRELDQSNGFDKETIAQEKPELNRNLILGLRDVIHVKEGYEWALEASLGTFANSLIMDQPEGLDELIDYLREKKTSGLGIFVKNSEPFRTQSQDPVSPQHPLIQCSLLDVVDVKGEYQDLLQPFLKNCYVVQSIGKENIMELLPLAQGISIVSQEGICIGGMGKIYFRQGLSQEQNLFQRGAEIETLVSEIEAKIKEKSEAFEAVRAAKSDYETTLVNLKNLQKERLDCKIQYESTESLQKQLEERLVSYKREKQLVMQDILEIQTQQSEVGEKKAELEKQLKELSEKEVESRDYETQLIHDIETKDSEKNKVLSEVAGCEARHKHIEDQETLLQSSINLLEDSDKQARERIETITQERKDIDQKEIDLADFDKRLQESQQSLADQLRQADLNLDRLGHEKTAYENNVKEIEEVIQKITDRQGELQEILHQAEMKYMDLGFQEKTIHERLQQTYQVNLAELDETQFPWEDRNVEEVEAELEKKRDKMKSMGAVNMLAIEEYDELKERYDFMTQQRQDMEDARMQLLEAIRKINRTTKSLFETTLKNVQDAFKEYYTTLFRGGDARLILVDETKPLESGIDVVVRPPGKRLQHISLLSGGEKALTAIALLFALFKIKPSPFCVLDEVDAPLDEANVDRFLMVLGSFLEKSQFIIITHNRKTISMGDSLYGVTMEEAGVSRIVSVKVGQDAKDFLPDEQSKNKGNIKEDSSVTA